MTFEQELIAQAVGPLVSIVVGTLLIGGAAAWITGRAQALAADESLRHELMAELTEAGSSLDLEEQLYYRAIGATPNQPADGSAGQPSRERRALDRQYKSSRVSGGVTESRLTAYYASDSARSAWHAAMDLLTVRYFDLIGEATDDLLADNAGDGHSRLRVDELREALKDQKVFRRIYASTLREASQEVLMAPLARRMSLFDRARAALT